MDTALARLNDANQDRAIESAATVLHNVTCDGAVLSPADVSVVADVRVGRTGAYLRRGLPCSPHVLTRCVLCCAVLHPCRPASRVSMPGVCFAHWGTKSCGHALRPGVAPAAMPRGKP